MRRGQRPGGQRHWPVLEQQQETAKPLPKRQRRSSQEPSTSTAQRSSCRRSAAAVYGMSSRQDAYEQHLWQKVSRALALVSLVRQGLQQHANGALLGCGRSIRQPAVQAAHGRSLQPWCERTWCWPCPWPEGTWCCQLHFGLRKLGANGCKLVHVAAWPERTWCCQCCWCQLEPSGSMLLHGMRELGAAIAAGANGSLVAANHCIASGANWVPVDANKTVHGQNQLVLMCASVIAQICIAYGEKEKDCRHVAQSFLLFWFRLKVACATCLFYPYPPATSH